MGMGTLNAYCLVAWAMVEVEHEKGTHTRACRMLLVVFTDQIRPPIKTQKEEK